MILRTLLAALTLVCLPVMAQAQTGSVKTPAQLNTEINTNFPDQTLGAITPFGLRQYSLDQVASVPFLNSVNVFTSANTFNGTTNLVGALQINGSALGTGVPTALVNAINALNGLVGFNGALGTPLSATLTNATGLPISGTTGWGTGIAAALAINANASGGICVISPTRAGDIVYWNGTACATLAGNNSGTQVLQETSSGVPSWATISGTGTVTSITCFGSAITTSGTCVTAAVKSDQTTATSTTLPVVPNVQQFHPSALKAVGYATVSGTTLTDHSPYGGVFTRTNVGEYTFTFTTNFTSTNYSCIATPTPTSTAVFAANIIGQAVGSVNIETTQATAFGKADVVAISLHCAGTQ